MSSVFATVARAAVKTLDVLNEFLHHRSSRHHFTAVSSSATATADADDDLFSRFTDLLKKFPKRPNPSPDSSPPLDLPPKPLQSDPFHYNSLMKSFGASGDTDQILRLFEAMKESCDCDPDVHCYTTVIAALASNHRCREAHAVFEEMISSGSIPDAACFTVMVKMYSFYLEKFDSAHEVIRWMLRCGCDPDVITYSTLIAGLCRSGKIEEAWGVLERMVEENCSPNAHTYTPILHAYCSRGQIGEAKRLLDWMESIGCRLDVVCYNVLIHGLCKIGDFDAVESVLGESNAKGWEPDAVSYNTYMNGLCKMGRIDEAFGKLEVMLDQGLRPTAVTLNIILDYLCRSSKVWEVKRLLERSSELELNVDVGTYNTVMSRLCDIKEWLTVFKLFGDMVKKGIRPDTQTFTILIYSLCKTRKFRKAKCIFDSKGFAANTVTCNILIHEFYMAGMIKELHLLLHDMERQNIAADVVTHCIMVDCLCRDGKLLEAVNFVRNLDSYSADVVAHLAYGLVKGGKLGELLRLFEDLLENGCILENKIFDFLIRSFCRKGSCNSKEIYKVCLILQKMLGTG